MAIKDIFARLWGGVVNVTTTAAMATDGTPGIIRAVVATSEAERAKQSAILTARNYHAGRQDVKLTARLREFLGNESGTFGVRLNYSSRVITSIVERLVVDGFKSRAADQNEADAQREFFAEVWTGSRMAGKRSRLFEQVMRDGEAFLLVDYDGGNGRPRLTPHARYTDTTMGGDGEGVVMLYPNNDTDMRPIVAAKRWTEHERRPDGATRQVARITIYTDAKIMRFARGASGWALAPLVFGDVELPAEENWTVDGSETGEPLGIPVVHLKSPTLSPVAAEAYAIQKGLNKIYVDMMAASDVEAFRLIFVRGFDPRDGDGEVAFNPGQMLFSLEPDADVKELPPSDTTRFVALIAAQVGYMADVTSTPLSLLQRSGQRAAEGTLQEEKEAFFAKIRDIQSTLEIGLVDAMRTARRLENTFGKRTFDDAAGVYVEWAPVNTRTNAERAADAKAMQESGFPVEQVWADAWGKTPEEIEAMSAAKQVEIDTKDRAAKAELTRWQAANEAQKAGVSPDQTLRDAGYTPEEIAAMEKETLIRVMGDGGAQ